MPKRASIFRLWIDEDANVADIPLAEAEVQVTIWSLPVGVTLYANNITDLEAIADALKAACVDYRRGGDGE